MRLSVVIPTYNKPERLRLVLQCFERQSLSPELFELIIVNDGGENLKRLKTEFKAGSFCWIDQIRRGRSGARNRGAQEAQGDWLLFVDDDLLFDRDFLKHHYDHCLSLEKESAVVRGGIYQLPYLRFFEKPTKDSNTVASENVGMSHYLLDELEMEKDFKGEVGRGAKLSRLEKDMKGLLSENERHPLAWISCNGGNLAVKLSKFNELKGFDEQFGLTWGGEDLELGYRLYQSGEKFRYCEKAINYHMTHHRPDHEEEHKQNHHYFYEKHPCLEVALVHDYLMGHLKMNDYLSQLQESEVK